MGFAVKFRQKKREPVVNPAAHPAEIGVWKPVQDPKIGAPKIPANLVNAGSVLVIGCDILECQSASFSVR